MNAIFRAKYKTLPSCAIHCKSSSSLFICLPNLKVNIYRAGEQKNRCNYVMYLKYIKDIFFIIITFYIGVIMLQLHSKSILDYFEFFNFIFLTNIK